MLRAKQQPLLLARMRSMPRTRTLALGGATRSASTASPQGAQASPAYVTAPMFAGLLRKTGLSPKALRALDAAAQQERRAGRDAFPIAVALSGGADSMALMLLLREHARHLKIETPLLAITVDHRLRPESSQEARDVGRMVTSNWGVEHVVAQCVWADDESDKLATSATAREPARPAKPRGSKLQEEARRYRYALLQRVCREKQVQRLYVAHNLGDQLETVLFRLGRASGINGLAGIASVSPLLADGGSDSDHTSDDASDDEACVELVRPLLSVPKAQLKETCRHFGQHWVEDPSNDKLLFDRIRIRKELERLEAARGPQVLQLFTAFQQSAARAKREFARKERQMLRKYVVKWESELVVLQMAFLDDVEMFDELRARLVSEIVLAVGSKRTPPRLASVSRLVRDLERLESGKTLTLSGCRITKKARGKLVHFQPER